MNFTKFDMVLLITMMIAIIGMSFTFPALGLTDVDSNESEVPDFDIQADRFDFAGEFPDDPRSPAHGEMRINNADDDDGEVFRTITSQANLILVPEEEDISDPVMGVGLMSLGGEYQDNHSFSDSEIGDTAVLEVQDTRVEVELIDVHNEGQPDFGWTIRYHILEDPSPDGEDGLWGTVPILGTAFNFASSVGAMVGWIGSILYWFFGTMFQTVLNLIGILVDAMAFMIRLVGWLTGTYGQVISSASAWATIFVLVPGVILWLELAKMAMIAISLLPTT